MKRLFVIVFVALSFSFTSVYYKFDKTPITEVELGKKLFFDTDLSFDRSISCASCHKPQFAFADSLDFSIGVGGKRGKRNAPTVMNISNGGLYFYDGRGKDLEDQVHFPIEDPNEMNISYDEVISRLSKNSTYISWFNKVYKQKPNRLNVAKAIASYERSLETSNTPFDRYMNEQKNGMNESAIRGREIFMSDKAKCFDCHFSPDFTGDEFKNIGLYNGKDWNDAGRFQVTNDSNDLGKFKVPGLRNIAVTAPYMHNGKMKTLREVIDFYSNPALVVNNAINIDSSLTKPINFTEAEKIDLENFLNALTDDRFTKPKSK
jgi:cytochrome c peroxidase